MNTPNTLSVCERKSQWISHNLLHSCSWGPHDMPAAEGLGRSAEHHSMPHCSSLFTACFSSNSPWSLSEENRTKSPPPIQWLPNTSINRSPLPTVNCQQATMVVPKSLLSYFFMLFVISNKARSAFCKNPLMLGTNKHNKQQLRKSALGLRLQSTVMPLFTGRICMWVTKDSNTACCCVWMYQKRVKCQSQLILHSGCHCLCPTLITNSKHCVDTSHLLHQSLTW